MKIAAFFLSLFATAGAIELTPDNWDDATADFADSETQLVADVDCTAEGKPLCDANGVRGYPTLKWGDPADLQDYQGGRDYNSLKKFADENLKPVCSPMNIELCDEDKKKQIEEFQALSTDEMDAKIADYEKQLEEAEETFKSEVSKLQAAYQKLSEEKDNKIAEVKDSGLGLLKSVKIAKTKTGSDEL